MEEKTMACLTLKEWSDMNNKIKELEVKLKSAIEIIAFYGDPDTYFAVGFFPDRPCGEIMEDFSETLEDGEKPGRKARDWIIKNYELTQPKDV